MSARTLSDMLYSIKDTIGLHASRGAVLSDVLDKHKISRLLGLRLIKTIMTDDDNDDDNTNDYDNKWTYSLINKRNERYPYDSIFFSDSITDISNVIIYSPKSQWWKSFGVNSIDMINFISAEDNSNFVKLRIIEIVAMAGTDGVIVTEFSKLLNIQVQSYHYFIDSLVAHDLLTKRMIIPINKKDPTVRVPKGEGIKAMVNIVHLKRFSQYYDPMHHYACIEYDSQTKSMLIDVIKMALANRSSKKRSEVSIKTLSKVLNLTRNEARDVKFVVNAAADNDDDDDVKVDDTLPFHTYLRTHSIYEQVRMLIMGTPNGICTDILRTVLKIEVKKASKLIDKFKNDLKYPTQEKLHAYNYSTFVLSSPPLTSEKDKEDALPPEYKNLNPNEIRQNLIMTILSAPNGGIEVCREMNEKVQAEISRIGMTFKMDRKMVQKTCQHLYDEKKVVLADMQLPEGILLFKLPEIKIIALPEVFNDMAKVDIFMRQAIDRLKPGAHKKPKAEVARKPPKPVKEKAPVKERAAPIKRSSSRQKVKIDLDSSTSDSESSIEFNDDDDDDDSFVVEDEIMDEDYVSDDSYDHKLEQVMRQNDINFKRKRDTDDSDSDLDDVQTKKLKKLAKSLGVDESDDDLANNNDQNDLWTPIQEAYALQYHLLNCLNRTLPKRNSTSLLPWHSIILRNLDTVDLSYIFGRSYTKEQMAKVGKKWAIIKSHLFRLLKTFNTIRKILAFILLHINLDQELAEVLNGVLDPNLFEERRSGSVTNIEQAAMTNALRVCASEQGGSLDALNEYSPSVKIRVENELLSSQLIQNRAQDLSGPETSVPIECTYELCDDKILSAERASFHYSLYNQDSEERTKTFGTNILSIADVLNPMNSCKGELNLMDTNQDKPFPIKVEDKSASTFDENNAWTLSSTKNTGHYHEQLNKINFSVKVTPKNEKQVSQSPALSTAVTSISNELDQHYEWLVHYVQEAGNDGVNIVKVIKALRDELRKDVNIDALNAIINKGVQEKLIFQIYDFIPYDSTQGFRPSLLVDIQYENLYRVYDGEDGTCPWINSDGVLIINFFNKLKANIKALLTSTPGIDFTLLHTHFAYLTKYQMELLLKRLIVEGFIILRTPAVSIRFNNPFDSATYPGKPCYFLSM